MKPKFPPNKNAKSRDSRGADSKREAGVVEDADALAVAAVQVIQEERESLGLSKRRAALWAKISPSQWGQVERRVNGSKAESNRQIRLKNHGKRLSFSKDEDIFAFPEDRNGIPEIRFSELDERISFPEVRLAFSDDTFRIPEDKNVFPEVTFSIPDIRIGVLVLSFQVPEIRFSKPDEKFPFSVVDYQVHRSGFDFLRSFL